MEFKVIILMVQLRLLGKYLLMIVRLSLKQINTGVLLTIPMMTQEELLG